MMNTDEFRKKRKLLEDFGRYLNGEITADGREIRYNHIAGVYTDGTRHRVNPYQKELNLEDIPRLAEEDEVERVARLFGIEMPKKKQK